MAQGLANVELEKLNLGFMSSVVPFTTVVAQALSKFRKRYPEVRKNDSDGARGTD